MMSLITYRHAIFVSRKKKTCHICMPTDFIDVLLVYTLCSFIQIIHILYSPHIYIPQYIYQIHVSFGTKHLPLDNLLYTYFVFVYLSKTFSIHIPFMHLHAAQGKQYYNQQHQNNWANHQGILVLIESGVHTWIKEHYKLWKYIWKYYEEEKSKYIMYMTTFCLSKLIHSKSLITLSRQKLSSSDFLQFIID